MGFLFPVQKVEKYGDITLIKIHKLAPDALILVIYVDILFIKGTFLTWESVSFLQGFF